MSLALCILYDRYCCGPRMRCSVGLLSFNYLLASMGVSIHTLHHAVAPRFMRMQSLKHLERPPFSTRGPMLNIRTASTDLDVIEQVPGSNRGGRTARLIHPGRQNNLQSGETSLSSRSSHSRLGTTQTSPRNEAFRDGPLVCQGSDLRSPRGRPANFGF